MKSAVSEFMTGQMARLKGAFDFSCFRECDCIEYQIRRQLSGDIVSRSLIFSINRFSRMIHVSRFYPELYRQDDGKYMSAASFFLLVHHMGQRYDLSGQWGIFLQCRTEIFHGFYEKLKDFDLRIRRTTLASSADIIGTYLPSEVDTSIVAELPGKIEGFTDL